MCSGGRDVEQTERQLAERVEHLPRASAGFWQALAGTPRPRLAFSGHIPRVAPPSLHTTPSTNHRT